MFTMKAHRNYGVLALFLCVFLAHADASAPTQHAATLNIRGGDSSSPYELNPSYQPSPNSKTVFPPPAGDMNMNHPSHMNKHQQPFMPHEFHVETTTQLTQQDQSFFPQQSPSFNDFQSIKDTCKQYVIRLYRTSPDLFALSTTSIFLFLLWQIPTFHAFLQRNFICTRGNLKAGRFHVALTAAVSHFSLFHLLFNLLTLLNLGPQVKSALKTTTNWPLWPLMMGSALTGSLSQALLGHRDGCLGLSGVTLALFAVLARLYPQRIISIRVMGIFPVSMASNMLLRVLLIWSVLGSFRTRTNIAHISHLGGILFGLVYYEVWLRQRQWRSRAFWTGLKG